VTKVDPVTQMVPKSSHETQDSLKKYQLSQEKRYVDVFESMNNGA